MTTRVVQNSVIEYPGSPAAVPAITLKSQIVAASSPEELMDLEAKAYAIEMYMRSAGLVEKMRDYCEARLLARWRLEQLLAANERDAGPGRGKKISRPGKSFMAYLKSINLDKNRAQEAQRIGALPEDKLVEAFAKAAADGSVLSIASLVISARSYWYKESREKKHRDIAVKATAKQSPKTFGPFPLIYADPPWKFEIYSPKGLERTPDQHYPTMTDDDRR